MQKRKTLIGLSLTGLLVLSGAAIALAGNITSTSTTPNPKMSVIEQFNGKLSAPTEVTPDINNANPNSFNGYGAGGYGMMGGYGDPNGGGGYGMMGGYGDPNGGGGYGMMGGYGGPNGGGGYGMMGGYGGPNGGGGYGMMGGYGGMHGAGGYGMMGGRY